MSSARFLDGSERTVRKKMEPDSTEITKILLNNTDETVVFEDICGRKAVGNLFSTRKKIADALGIREDQIVSTLIKAVENPGKADIVETPEFKKKSLGNNLDKLPICRYYPEDGGRYISSGIIISEYKGKKNISFHRMMLIGGNRMAVRLVPRHLYKMYSDAKENGEELKIAICIGARPEVLLAAATSTAFETDEMDIASGICRKTSRKQLSVGLTDNGLYVPSDCDYVFEGKITLDTIEEGPFVDITGTYDYVREQPVIEIDKIWSCENPYFHYIVPGSNEHYLFMGLPREPMMYLSVKKAVGNVKAVRLTEGGCCWLNGIVSIRKKKKDDGTNAGLAALDGHKSMKNVIVVDDDIDIFDDREVEWAVATRFQATRLKTLPDSKGSSLDPSADDSITCKVVIDATMPAGADKKNFTKAVL